jgi:uncharacterized repeat protein (TIGR02543 family)
MEVDLMKRILKKGTSILVMLTMLISQLVMLPQVAQAAASVKWVWTEITADGGFEIAAGITVNSSGSNVYVTDEGTGQVKKYNGTSWTAIPTDELAPVQLSPGIALDSSGNVYVVDSSVCGINKYDGTSWSPIYEQNESGPTWPKGIAVDKNNHIYVTDINTAEKAGVTGGKVWKYDGASWSVINASDMFVSPYDVAVDDSGNIYVVDQANNLVKKKNVTSGAWETYTGTDFNSPLGIAATADGKKVYVADSLKYSVKEFKDAAWGTITPDGSPLDVAVDGSGNVYVAYQTKIYKGSYTALSSDATLKSTTTIKGVTVTSFGTPAATIDGAVAGSVTLTAVQGADTSNAGSYITAFVANDANGTVSRVVKYANGVSTANFASDTVYNGTAAITNGDLFVVKVTAEDGTIMYYNIAVTVSTSTQYTVTFDSQGGSEVDPIINIAPGATITLPTAPTNAGYSFGGWFTEANGGGTAFTETTQVNANITVYAKWSSAATKPTVTAVSLASGSKLGGNTVTITGTGFTGATAVKFGNTAASNINIDSDTQITVKAPAGSVGTVDITVTTPDGTSAISSADQYTYTNAYSVDYTISKVAGTGDQGSTLNENDANLSQLSYVQGVTFDRLGNMYIADAGSNRILKVDKATKKISIAAGTGTAGYSGDLGLAINANLQSPEGVAFDSHNNMYIADFSNKVIRKVDYVTNIITTYAGGGQTTIPDSTDTNNVPDSILALSAIMDGPYNLAFDSNDNLYIVERNLNFIYKVDNSGNISVAHAGYSDNLSSPTGVAIDNSGKMYIADQDNSVIRMYDPINNTMETVAGIYQNSGYSGDGGLATQAKLDSPSGVAVDSKGNLYIMEYNNAVIRFVEKATGNIYTIAGTKTGGSAYNSSKDNGPALLADIQPSYAGGITVDSDGNVYFTDESANVVRKLAPNQHFVTYNSNGATLGSVPTDNNLYASGDKFTVPDNTGSLVKTGFTFAGWNTQADGGTTYEANDTFTMGVANVTLYAKWTADAPISYTVIFDSQGGSAVASKTNIAAGAGFELPVPPTRTGYTFGGWYKEAGCTNQWVDGTDTVNSNITLYAKWTADAPSGGNGGDSSSGGGDYTPPSPPQAPTKVTGDVINEKGESVKGIPAQVTTETNGTKAVEIKSQEAILFKQADGTNSTLSDLTKLGFSAPVTTGNISNTPSVTINTDGTIKVKNLPNGSETKFDVTMDLGNGQKLVIGKMDVKVSQSGDVSLTSELIDPYGIITDAVTGEVIAGADVTLYYADTARNRANGKTPNTMVVLPIIDGFKPNNNKDPQVSDNAGAYGWMVYPTTDYYIVSTKAGYNKYTSPTISVEYEIVKWDFQMTRVAPTVERLAGPRVVDTALAIAKAEFTRKVSSVIIATSGDYPDALSGSALAYNIKAPIILVGDSEEDQQKVFDYIQSNLESSGTVYILGGTAAVSSEVETKINSLGFNNIVRLGGEDRYETCAKIIDRMNPAVGTPIIITFGEYYMDAISVSSVSAFNNYPVLLVRNNDIPESIKNEIQKIKPSKIYVMGLTEAVSSSVEDLAAKLAGLDKKNVVRIGGANGFDTSLEAAKYFNLNSNTVCITTGNNFPDALSGSIYAAKNGAPIMLVDNTLTEAQKTYLRSKNLSKAVIFGGELAVNKEIEKQLVQLFEKK